MPRKEGDIRNVPYKVIDTWYYDVKDVEIDRLDWQEDHDDDATFDQKYKPSKERIKNKKVSIEVRMDKTTIHTEPPHPLRSVKIELYCKELDIKMEGTDFEALRAAMWGNLDKKFEVQWHRYYLVEILKTRGWSGGDGTGLSLEYRDVYKGITWNGSSLLKIWRGHEHKIEPWPGQFTDKTDKIIACVPATEQNRKALEEFARRIDTMRKLMSDFLRPEKIMETLANLSKTMPFLPPPGPPEPEEDEKHPLIELKGATQEDAEPA